MKMDKWKNMQRSFKYELNIIFQIVKNYQNDDDAILTPYPLSCIHHGVSVSSSHPQTKDDREGTNRSCKDHLSP